MWKRASAVIIAIYSAVAIVAIDSVWHAESAHSAPSELPHSSPTTFPSSQTKGNVHITLLSVSRTYRFERGNVRLDDAGAPWVIPYLHVEYVVEYLGDDPIKHGN